MENISPQSKRLKEFVDLTGYSLNEFAKQCEIASVRTIAKIITEGATPTSKVLEKIIARFPQLNHDWVVLGYGEMIVKGLQTQETSTNSLEKSSESSYQYIIQALRDHDFALNETSKSVEKANQKVDTTARLMIETVNQYRKEQQERAVAFFDKVDLKIERGEKFFINELEGIRKNAEKLEIENRALIQKLDHERKERNQENFDKLSRKIHEYLKESRELQEQIIQKKLDEGIKFLNDEMHKNAISQTDFAIKALLDKFSLKKILPKLGSPEKVSNPKHQK
tara:strand:- start:5000 stop:5842 length:843 start_codon:yes stop_codon:yes gene_type:complete